MLQLYTKNSCPQCVNAKKLLQAKNIPYKEIIIGVHIMRESFVEYFPSIKSVPLIVDDGIVIGGFDGLVEYLKEQRDDSAQLLQG